ncbi:MAG: hypothetical protein HQM06_17910, partial [Magnetococcales bacterium]|nr:hypothetical protein [Magnetococcales bacterium]
FQKAADAGGKDAGGLGEAGVIGHLGGVGGDQLTVHGGPSVPVVLSV